MGPSVYAFAAMLACYLLGMATGSLAAARWTRKTRLAALSGMALLEGLLGAAVLGGLFYFNRLPEWNFWLFRWAGAWSAEWGFGLAHVAVAALVVGLPCLVMGAVFPLAVGAIQESGGGCERPEATVGRLYLLNTVGGIAGSLAAGFWLVPQVGAWNMLIGAGVMSVGVGGALWLLSPRRPRWRRAAEACAAVAVAALLAAAAPPWNVVLFNQGYYREVYTEGKMDLGRLKNQRLVFYKEGINSPVAVFNVGGDASLRVSGKADASANPTDLYTQLFVGHLPVMFARDPRRAAVIGYGSGMSAMAVLTHPNVESLDVLEIERAVIDAAPYFEHISGRPLADPRVRLILEDGRTHLSYTGRTYDVITSEPSNPWMAGVANLFTVDFYRTVRERLSAGGVFGQWIQTYEISPEAFRVILASVHEVFPHIVVFHSGPSDIVVLASGESIRVPWREFEARFRAQRVQASVARVDIRSPFQLAYYMQGPEEAVDELLRGVRIRNTDDNAWLEHRMSKDLLRSQQPPSAGANTVSQSVASLGASRHLRALEEMLPGIPLGDCVEGLLEHALGTEPAILPGGGVPDPGLATRSARIAGMLQEIEQMNDPELLRRFEASRLDRLLLDSSMSTASYDALVGLGNVAVLQRRLEEATTLLERAAARNLYFPNAYASLATLYVGQNDLLDGSLGLLGCDRKTREQRDIRLQVALPEDQATVRHAQQEHVKPGKVERVVFEVHVDEIDRRAPCRGRSRATNPPC